LKGYGGKSSLEGGQQAREISSGPQPQDAVLGGRATAPAQGGVLGGLEGVRQRLAHADPAQRRLALHQLSAYGVTGLELLVQALQDPSLEVQRGAYTLLRHNPVAIAQQALQQYCAYPLFERIATLAGHQEGITAVAFSEDAQILVSSSRDRTVKVWDAAAQEEILSFRAPFFVNTLTLSPDGRAVLLRDTAHQLRLWSLRNGQELPLDQGWDWGIALSGVGEFSTETRRGLSPRVPPDTINQLAQGWLDEDAQWTTPEWAIPERGDRPLNSEDVNSEEKGVFQSQPENSLSPRTIASTLTVGDRYLCSSSQASIRIWDLHQGREVAVLRGHTSLVTAIAATSRGDWIVSGSEDRTVGLWGVP
jgi:WD40 repeat protein